MPLPLIVPRPSSTLDMPYTTANTTPDNLHNPNSCSRSSTKRLRIGASIPLHQPSVGSQHTPSEGGAIIDSPRVSCAQGISCINLALHSQRWNEGFFHQAHLIQPNISLLLPLQSPIARNHLGPVITSPTNSVFRYNLPRAIYEKQIIRTLQIQATTRHGTIPRAFRAAGATANHGHHLQTSKEPTNALYKLPCQEGGARRTTKGRTSSSGSGSTRK